MIDLCTRKSSRIQDDTSQCKCSASVPVPTGSHWIVIGVTLPGLTGALSPSFPPASMAWFIKFSAGIIPLHQLKNHDPWPSTKRKSTRPGGQGSGRISLEKRFGVILCYMNCMTCMICISCMLFVLTDGTSPGSGQC